MMRFALLVLVACGSSSSQEAPKPQPVARAGDAAVADGPALTAELRAKWERGCFLMRTRGGGTIESDRTRCTQPRRPYSTFKLANSLIGLDAGVLAGADAPMAWDKKAVPDNDDFRPEWRKPQTLRTAFQLSSVPHFRTLARTLGEQRMKAGLAKLGYGNQDIGGGLDLFWLRGDMRISAEQQLAFVDALAHGTLDVSAQAQAVVRDISEIEKRGDRVLHGKTGSGHATDLDPASKDYLVWQVGWIDDHGEVEPYAAWLQVSGGTFDEARGAREALLRETLGALGVF